MADESDAISEIERDHRKIRDGLLEMISALEKKDMAASRDIFEKMNVIAGPHFRYEEEALYPKLRIFFGNNIDRLFKEHDGVYAVIKTCIELLKNDRLTTEEERCVMDAVHDIMFHVSNCDGLAIFAERLSKKEIGELGDKLAEVRKIGLSLLEWLDTARVRGR